MEKTNILFLGRFYPQRLFKTINEDSKGKVGFANHNFEMSIIYGLENQSVNLRLISIPEVYSWPHNNKRLLTPAENYTRNGIPVTSIGFCNILILNKISVLIHTLFNLLRQYRKFKGRQVHLICNASNIYMLMAVKLSRLFTKKKIDVTAIIPDIPSMISQMHERKGVKGKVIAIMDKLNLQLLGQCEQHVLLTEAMTDFFARPVRHIVMEGLIDERNFPAEIQEQDADKRIILYTGSIHHQFGIMNLVEAFESATLPENVELWICGSGDTAKDLKDKAEKNPSIKYWGLVDIDTARAMQRKASVLVNPRTSEHSFTKYSFPSKTLEYMMTGKPVVMNRLPGIPQDYFKYLITPEGESIGKWAEILKKIMLEGYDKAKEKGYAGREFVLKHKNARVQMERVVNFILEK